MPLSSTGGVAFLSSRWHGAPLTPDAVPPTGSNGPPSAFRFQIDR